MVIFHHKNFVSERKMRFKTNLYNLYQTVICLKVVFQTLYEVGARE